MNEYRISNVLKELNIGMQVLVDFLNTNGEFVEYNHHVILTQYQYDMIKCEFEVPKNQTESNISIQEESNILVEEDNNLDLTVEDEDNFYQCRIGLRRGYILFTDNQQITDSVKIVLTQHFNYKELADAIIENLASQDITLIFDLESNLKSSSSTEGEDSDKYPLLKTISLIAEHRDFRIICVGFFPEKDTHYYKVFKSHPHVKYLSFPFKDDNTLYLKERDDWDLDDWGTEFSNELISEISKILFSYDVRQGFGQSIREAAQKNSSKAPRIKVIGKIDIGSIPGYKPPKIAKEERKAFFEKKREENLLKKEDVSIEINSIREDSNPCIIHTAYLPFDYNYCGLGVTQKINVVNIDPLKGNRFNIIDLIFKIRIIEKNYNPIICVGFLPVRYFMEDQQYAILFAKGICYLQLPFSNEELNETIEVLRRKFNNIDENSYLKAYFGSRVSEIINKLRHSYANYSGMYMILKMIGNGDKSYDIIKNKFPDLYRIICSIDFKLLSYYYGFDKISYGELKNIDEKSLERKNILLIDDLSNVGWGKIVSKMIYNSYEDCRFRYVFKKEDNKNWEKTIESSIHEHKPHLILLDLRLEKEIGIRRLDDLGGYKVLNWLKDHEIFKGIPVLIFTSSNKAESTSRLIKKGAEAVWIKPGFDELSGPNMLVARYNSLIKIIAGIFNDYYNINNVTYTIYKNFDEARELVYNKIVNLESRINLNPSIKEDNIFQQNYSHIYIDSCVFLQSQKGMSFFDTFCNLFVLANICKQRELSLQIIKKEQNVVTHILLPKVIVVNDVFDEIYKYSKINENDLKNIWKYALLTYEIFRILLDKNKIRTEINSVNKNDMPVCKSYRKEHVYADGFLINELSNLYRKRTCTLFSLKNDGLFEYSKDKEGKKMRGEKNIIKNEAIYLNTDKDKTLIITYDGPFINKINEIFRPEIENGLISVQRIQEFNNSFKEIIQLLI